MLKQHKRHSTVQPTLHRRFSLKTTKEGQSKKRTAIVTGSSRGIGEAIARRLVHDGYAVAITDIAANAAGVAKLVKELNETYGDRSSVGVVADVTSSSDVKNMVEESVKQLGPLTVMIANAGICGVGAALDTSNELFERIMKVNLTGVWNCYTHAARQMVAQGPVPEGSTGYKIMGASSIAAYKPFPLLAPYCASKWAVKGMTQVFALELAQYKINVNCYAPGIVGTAMWETLDETLGKMQGRPKGEIVKKYVDELTAMGRVSVPEDVSKVVGFLCGPDSAFVTGQNIVVDGGIVFS
ncbi:acetoin dehydrogenase [Halenospora varia]|nr:acetoin dehydrogenase [Halenospora varia]